MSLKIYNSYNPAYFDLAELHKPENQQIKQNSSANLQKVQTKLPKISHEVSFTALGCDTESKLARAAYMATAAHAGIADITAQNNFADQMLVNRSELTLNDSPIDDKDVKSKLLNRNVTFTIDNNQKAALEKFRDQYIKDGGKIIFNAKPTIDLREAQTADGVKTTQLTPPNTKFNVMLNNDGKPINAERILAQYAENTYKCGNLWGDNFRKIGELSADQGIKPKVTNITNVGNKKFVEFQLTPFDRSVVNENYKTVQTQVNEIEKLVEKINRDNPVSQFTLGAINGIKDNLVGTAMMVAHPLETLAAIKDAVVALSSLSADDVSKIAGLVKDKVKTTFTTKDGINSLPYGAGYAVGMIATDVVIGKGFGAALEGLKEIPQIAKLLTKLEDLKSLSKVKIAETFSDEAASLASQRIRKALRNPNLYGGFAGAEFLGDLTKFAGNKLKNGAMSFKQFTVEATKEFGDGIKGKVDELAISYRNAMQNLGLGNEIIELDIEQTSKMAKMQFQRETNAARQKLLEGIQEAENKGKILELSQSDREWLLQSPRHKELAFDPANKTFKINEAQVALEAETKGILQAPVKRGIDAGGNEIGVDFFDGNGIAWDVKESVGGSESILDALRKNENVLVDTRNLSEKEFQTLKSEIAVKRVKNDRIVKYLR